VHYFLIAFKHKGNLEKWSTADLYRLVAVNREFGLGVLRLMREQEVEMVAVDSRRLPLCEYHVDEREMRCPGKGIEWYMQ
jgi:dissimilatory sulfite reductase (desulfoviridin) alpha/beta subunit